MRSMMLLASAALVPSLVGCGGSPAEGELAAAATTEVQAVKNLETLFITGWEAKDPAVKALYAPNAVMVMPNAPPRNTPVTIAQTFDRYAANPTAEIEFHNASTVISAGGDLAFSQGTYTSGGTNADSGEAQQGKGYYLLVYKKQADGSWKVIQDVSSPLPDDFEPPSPL